MSGAATPAGALPLDAVEHAFRDLQSRIVAALEALDGQAFRSDAWTRGGSFSRRSALATVGRLLPTFSATCSWVRPTSSISRW